MPKRTRRLYAAHLRNLGRFDEALSQIRTSRTLDPLFAFAHIEEGITLYVARRHDEALRTFQRYLQVAPRDVHAWMFVALVHTARGAHEEALAALDRADPQGITRMRRRSAGACTLAWAVRTRRDESSRCWTTWPAPRARYHRSTAAIYLELGDHERALDLLEQAARQPVSQMRLIKVEPTFDPLAHHPRFQALLRRVGLQP